MTLRKGHGNGAGSPRIEVLPADELPAGVPAATRAESPTDRGDRGKFARGNSLAALGGRSRNGETKLARRLRLADVFADPKFEPYASAARGFRRAQVGALARNVGGGYCGPAPASIIASASLQLAASRYAFEVLGDMALGSRLANDSRQNLLAAHELCAREAAGRPKPVVALPWLANASPASDHDEPDHDDESAPGGEQGGAS